MGAKALGSRQGLAPGEFRCFALTVPLKDCLKLAKSRPQARVGLCRAAPFS